jgi:hypothetical protein
MQASHLCSACDGTTLKGRSGSDVLDHRLFMLYSRYSRRGSHPATLLAYRLDRLRHSIGSYEKCSLPYLVEDCVLAATGGFYGLGRRPYIVSD